MTGRCRRLVDSGDGWWYVGVAAAWTVALLILLTTVPVGWALWTAHFPLFVRCVFIALSTTPLVMMAIAVAGVAWLG